MTNRIEIPGRPHPELVSDKTSAYNEATVGLFQSPIKSRMISSIRKSISRLQRGGRQGDRRERTYSVHNLGSMVQVSVTRTHLFVGKTAAELTITKSQQSPYEPLDVNAVYSAGDFANMGDDPMFDYMRVEGPLQDQSLISLGIIATTMRRAAKATEDSPIN